jgi:precorrin-2 dehydrogenase/sirohydrochlorin ferrochelatase
VAARKSRGLTEAGADVTVVSPATDPAMDALVEAGSVVLERRPYRPGEAVPYALVVTATGVPSVDQTVVDDARGAGVPVNSADGDRPGTVRLPAVIRRGAVTVAVSTGGTSPALAQWLRDRIAGALPPELETLVALVDEARSEVRASGRSTDSVDWVGSIDQIVLPLVAEDRIDEARAALRKAWHLTEA